MTSPDSPAQLLVRWTAIFLGLITFIWLPLEDQNLVFLILLAAGWSAWLAAWWVKRFKPDPDLKPALIIGAGGGVVVFPTAMVLTLVKAGLHDHGFLDFSTAQLATIAGTIPLWVGLGIVLSMLWLRKHLIDPE